MVCKLLICGDAEEVTTCGQNQTDVQLTTAAPENLQENVLKEPLDKKGLIEKLLRSQPINIPVFHKVALRLLQMMNAHSYKIEEAIVLVNEDAALAAAMLSHANSTYNSGKAPITTIKNAIVRLGSQQVVNLAFAASMSTSKSNNPLINSYLKTLWYHSHAVAVISSWLAVQLGHDNKRVDINADEVYLAGLFHAVGKLYLLKSMDNLIEAGILQDDDSMIGAIIDELNIPMGIRVIQHYNIPDIYLNSVERHITDDWKCGINDHFVAAVRLSCKTHNYIMQGIAISEETIMIKDELSLLNIDDAASIYDIAKAITGEGSLQFN
ncbi:MAG: HDOD domain-containing protein [Desulfuromonadaceae bacterium]|nr:HDOD domain-containing protein [Desulfuromonadaceae bacterium]